MQFVQLPKEQWETFFDELAVAGEGLRTVRIEVSGPSIGDQVIAERLPLNGLTYDRKADAFYVFSNGDGESLDHAISHPREIWVDFVGRALSRVVLVEAEGRQQFLTIREPIALPRRVSESLLKQDGDEPTVGV